ncbi:MAG TPA: FtsK/SpoIIIE domain-containing protein [Micromonosporaceae bacterium]|jgi:S-DNA-T family DNA segregation ATPase FtsK/SpoIIIE
MTHLPEWLPWVPAVVLAAFAAAVLARVVVEAVRYVRAGRLVRPMWRRAWRIRWTWAQTARRVGLVHTERSSPPWWSSAKPGTSTTRTLVPPIRVRADRWGVQVEASTVGQLGLVEFQNAARHLADAWRVPTVRVTQPKAGLVRLRALVVDPLTEPLEWTDDELAGDVATWVAGIDQDGQPVTIRAAEVSGIVVAGLAGYGKTVFLNARFCALAENPAVQFVLIDGKGGPDYDDLFARAWLSAKDEPEKVRDHLVAVHGLMKARQDTIRTLLGVKNVWHVGPSPSWPLVLVVIDEAHTFLNESKGTDPESKRLDGIARQTVRLVEELVRKGRNVGIQVVLATQKPTGDAIPTRIRDNCQVSLSFAQRTSEAAVAVLGADITEFPDEHRRRLVDPAYVGVASMVAQGRPGFTLVRTPYVPDAVADRIARRGAHLVRDPIELQTTMCTPPRTGPPPGSWGESGGPFRQEQSAALRDTNPYLMEGAGSHDDDTRP